jgi:hypothetical protein
LFEDWLTTCGIDLSYNVPVLHFGRDLVLEMPEGEADNVELHTSNVASFSRHTYFHKAMTNPSRLPSRTKDGPVRHLYHNGPSGIITSKDHLVMTWTCSSLSFHLSLDGKNITPEPVQVSPFDILDDCLERTLPESTSIRAHSDYFFAMALWRHGSAHLKSVVTHRLEASHLFSSRILSDLTTELLRFSSRHSEHQTLPAVMRDLVERARCCLEEKASTTLATLHEDNEEGASEDTEDLGSYVMTFLTTADRWYERHMVGSNPTADPCHRRWASFWDDAVPLIRGVRSLAKSAARPAIPSPRTAPGLERQFSCMGVPLPPIPPTLR